jgi:hypothetical protein
MSQLRLFDSGEPTRRYDSSLWVERQIFRGAEAR